MVKFISVTMETPEFKYSRYFVVNSIQIFYIFVQYIHRMCMCVYHEEYTVFYYSIREYYIPDNILTIKRQDYQHGFFFQRA